MNTVDFRTAYHNLLQARIAYANCAKILELAKRKLEQDERAARKTEAYAVLKNEQQRKDYMAETLANAYDCITILEDNKNEAALELSIARDRVEMHNGLIEMMKLPDGCQIYGDVDTHHYSMITDRD